VKRPDGVPWDAVASVLRYPTDGYGEGVLSSVAALDDRWPDAHVEMAAFAETVEALTPGECEELFTRTFDLNPACCLDLGWHLYGEAYERGRFLVTMRGLLRQHDVTEDGELPDHLSNVLRLLGRMERGAACRLAEESVAPALNTMCTAIEGKDNPYTHVLTAVRTLVRETLSDKDTSPEVCNE